MLPTALLNLWYLQVLVQVASERSHWDAISTPPPTILTPHTRPWVSCLPGLGSVVPSCLSLWSRCTVVARQLEEGRKSAIFFFLRMGLSSLCDPFYCVPHVVGLPPTKSDLKGFPPQTDQLPVFQGTCAGNLGYHHWSWPQSLCFSRTYWTCGGWVSWGRGDVEREGSGSWGEGPIGVWVPLWRCWGFPDSSVGKETACNAGDPSSIPGSGRSTEEGIGYLLQYSWASLVAQLVKNLPAMQGTWVWSLGWKDCLKKGKTTHPSILAWRIPWGHRVEHKWAIFTLRMLSSTQPFHTGIWVPVIYQSRSQGWLEWASRCLPARKGDSNVTDPHQTPVWGHLLFIQQTGGEHLLYARH